MHNEATVREIKPPNQARRPWTCDFDFVTCHPFDVSWDRGVWAERQGGKNGGAREGGRERRGAIVGTLRQPCSGGEAD